MDFSVFQKIFLDMGFVHLTFGNVIMWVIALTFIVLAITKNYEAMKMENPIFAPSDGTVKEIKVKEKDSVEAEQVLVVLE